MSAEDEIGQDVDQLVRTLLTVVSQIRERNARRAQDQASQRQAMERAAAERHEQTQRVHEVVSRPEFWDQARSDQIAAVAAYTGLVAQHDPLGAAAHDIVRNQLKERFGIDLDEIDRAHPRSDADRSQALRDAIDDARAAQREQAEVENDADEAAEDKDRSEAPGTDQDEPVSDRAPSEAEHDEDRETSSDPDAAREGAVPAAEESGARTHAGATSSSKPYSRSDENDLKDVPAPAAAARRESASNFPESANASLRSASRGRHPRARKTTGAVHGRDQELTR